MHSGLSGFRNWMFNFLMAQMNKNETKPDKKFNNPFWIMTVVNTIFVDGFTKQNIIFQNLPLGIPNIDAKIIPFINVNGMKKFLKKSCFIWGRGKLATFQVAREELWSLFS